MSKFFVWDLHDFHSTLIKYCSNIYIFSHWGSNTDGKYFKSIIWISIWNWIILHVIQFFGLFNNLNLFYNLKVIITYFSPKAGLESSNKLSQRFFKKNFISQEKKILLSLLIYIKLSITISGGSNGRATMWKQVQPSLAWYGYLPI